LRKSANSKSLSKLRDKENSLRTKNFESKVKKLREDRKKIKDNLKCKE
jgi:hypothetical protein